MKNAAIKRVKDLYSVEHYRSLQSIPPQCRCTPAYSDRTANGLTKCTLDWLRLSGWQAERINVMGRPIDRRRVVTDCIGRKRQIGSLQWIPSGSTPGSADISATVAGRSVKIEIKIGRDTQSEAQRKYQQDIEASGGVYIIAKDFEGFLKWYDLFIEEVNHGK
jgi:hypothetical protein